MTGHERLLIGWIRSSPFWISKLNKKDIELEKSVACEFLKSINVYQNHKSNQFTTLFGEHLVKYYLEKMGYFVSRFKSKKLIPDWIVYENDKPIALVEVKARTYAVSGTAGDKIYKTPFKYSELVERLNIPLLIICVGRQEYETFIKDKRLHQTNIMNDFTNLLTNHRISYVKLSDMVFNKKYIRKVISRLV